MNLHKKFTVIIKRSYCNHRAVLERNRGIQFLLPKISFVTYGPHNANSPWSLRISYFMSLRTIRENIEEKICVPNVFFFLIIIQFRLSCLQRNLSIYLSYVYSIHNVHIRYKAICTADIIVRNQTCLSRVSLYIHNFEEWFCYKFWSALGLIHNPRRQSEEIWLRRGSVVKSCKQYNEPTL